MLHGKMSKHIHSCDACAARAPADSVQDDLITIRKPTTSAEMLWLLKLAHLVLSDVGKTLEESVAPAQPVAEPSRFGSPELQAMIIARCVEKDQAESVLEDAARYRFLRDGEWRDTDLEPFIRLQLNTLWDAKIDAARKQGDKP